jgi:hypothetical protein
MGIERARQAARGVIHRFGVRSPEHVKVEAFAAAFGVEIVEVPLDGAAAQLVRTGTRAQIQLAARITDPAVRRFNIAHELGHLVLKHPSRSAAELCAPRPARQGCTERRDLEAEANAFAGELLMPAALVRRRCEVSPVDLGVPRAIAAASGVSILASTIRFAELSSERCAAVFSARGVVRWVAASATFTHEISRGHRIDREAVAWGFFARGTIEDRPQAVPADAWLETDAEVEVIEHAIASPDFGTVLSMVWVPEAVAPRLGMA